MVDNGFGLSIIEEPAVHEICTGASNPSAALGSNPPTNPSSSIVTSTTHSRCMSTDISECPEDEQQVLAMDSYLPTTRLIEDISGMDKKDKTEHYRSVGRFSGQRSGLPLREQYHRQGAILDDQHPDLNVQVSSRQAASNTHQPAQVNELDHTIACILQSSRNQDAAIRARKIRELYLARQNTDAAMDEQHKQYETQSDTGVTNSDDTLVFPTPPDSVQGGSQSTLSVEYHTGYTPLADNVSMSPIMLVAEQAPIPRGRRIEKPARLVLGEQRAPKPFAIAVRTGDETVFNPTPKLTDIQFSTSLQEPALRNFEAPLKLRKEECQQMTSATTSSFQQMFANMPPTPPSGPPPKSPAREELLTQRRISAPLLSPISIAVQPQAVTATKIRHHRTSISSSHTSNSKGMRLEARLEALERENRLLEAALMAVLKTSGTLNRCPCVLHSKTTEAIITPGIESLGKRGGALLHHDIVGQDHVGPRGAEERKESVETNGSSESGVSALEVYFGTRVGN
jgi:hypothetical protein